MVGLARDDDSDFGLDFSSGDEALLCELVDAVSAPATGVSAGHHAVVGTQTQFNPLPPPHASIGDNHALETDFTTHLVRGPALDKDAPSPTSTRLNATGLPTPAPTEPAAGEKNRDPARKFESMLRSALPDPAAATTDVLPPLSRFRTYPRKGLTVTDLTAGAWCELQYFYTLTLLPGGRKTATKAMRAGTKVHLVLERQVHETVRIEVASREDAVGVRAWNLVQGLRALAENGLTRELEVWGNVGGNIVSGIVDGLGWENPDDEAAAPERESIERYFTPGRRRLVYVTDVKTRGSKTVPAPSAVVPARIQLFLYHRFLRDMITDQLNYLKVFRRYGADPDEPFTDEFLAQVAGMHEDMFFDSPSSAPSAPPSTDRATASPEMPDVHLPAAPSSPTASPVPVGRSATPPEALAARPSAAPSRRPPPFAEESPREPSVSRYRTLRELLPLIKTSLALAFPDGTASLSPRLCVEYRHQGGDGDLIARRTFDADPEALDAYIAKDLEWWRGERPPQGVAIEDAFKCRSCEFVEECDWRRGRDEERLRAAREKLFMRKRKITDEGLAASQVVGGGHHGNQ